MAISFSAFSSSSSTAGSGLRSRSSPYFSGFFIHRFDSKNEMLDKIQIILGDSGVQRSSFFEDKQKKIVHLAQVVDGQDEFVRARGVAQGFDYEEPHGNGKYQTSTSLLEEYCNEHRNEIFQWFVSQIENSRGVSRSLQQLLVK